MKKKTIRRVLALIRPYRITVAGSLFFALISAAAQLLIPVFSGNAIDAMIGEGQVTFSLVTRAILLIAVTALLGAAAQRLLALCNNRITFSVSRDLRNRLNSKFHKLPLSYLDTHPSGDMVSRMVSDVDTFADGLLMGFTQLFTGVITIAGTLGFMKKHRSTPPFSPA